MSECDCQRTACASTASATSSLCCKCCKCCECFVLRVLCAECCKQVRFVAADLMCVKASVGSKCNIRYSVCLLCECKDGMAIDFHCN